MKERERQSVEERLQREHKKLRKGTNPGSGRPIQGKVEKLEQPIGAPVRSSSINGKTHNCDEQTGLVDAQLSKAELKRQRKLERRAQRRIQKELTGVSP